MRDDIAKIVGGSNSQASAESKLKAWAEALKGDPRIVDAIMQPAVKADLGGQLFVSNVEVEQKTRMLADNDRPAFLDLPFREALQYWTDHGGSPEMLKRVLAAYKKNAEAAGQLFPDVLLSNTVAQLDRALREGSTLRDFQAAVEADAIAFGISPASSGYLENVFRTNIQTAYGAGRYRQLTNPDVIAVRPWVQYRTAGDTRVRNSHRALDGLIFKAASSEWRSIAPPNGYQCRCSMVSLDNQDVHDEIAANPRGPNIVTDRIPQDGNPDPGFDGPPTAPRRIR